jgi:hypothetical protein
MCVSKCDISENLWAVTAPHINPKAVIIDTFIAQCVTSLGLNRVLKTRAEHPAPLQKKSVFTAKLLIFEATFVSTDSASFDILPKSGKKAAESAMSCRIGFNGERLSIGSAHPMTAAKLSFHFKRICGVIYKAH